MTEPEDSMRTFVPEASESQQNFPADAVEEKILGDLTQDETLQGLSLTFKGGPFKSHGSITAVDVNQEVLLQVSAQPVKENRIVVFLQRAQSYKNVPVTSDKKHCSDKGDEDLSKWPFRIHGGKVEYKEIEVDGEMHFAAYVDLINANSFSMTFTKVGSDLTGPERSRILSPALAREWDLMILDSVSHRELTKTRIQVYAVVRKPTKKHSEESLKSEVGGKRQKMKETKPEKAEEVGMESKMAEESENGQCMIEVPASESGRGLTLVAFYTINNSNMTIPLGLEWYKETDPLNFTKILSEDRAAFKKLAVQKLLNHFEIPPEGVEVDVIPDENIIFTLNSLSDLGKKAFQRDSWPGGPIEAARFPEFIQPLTGANGLPFHVIDCRISISTLETLFSANEEKN